VIGLRLWNRRSGCPDALDLVGAAARQVGGSAAVSPEARSATMLWWAAVGYPTGVFAIATARGNRNIGRGFALAEEPMVDFYTYLG
jgi:hypothetical protein